MVCLSSLSMSSGSPLTRTVRAETPAMAAPTGPPPSAVNAAPAARMDVVVALTGSGRAANIRMSSVPVPRTVVRDGRR